MSRRACWKTARRARASNRRRCCSAPAAIPAALELELTRRNIPFVKFGGLKFLDAAHVKDALAAAALRREPARPRGGLPRHAAAARRRAGPRARRWSPRRPGRRLRALAPYPAPAEGARGLRRVRRPAAARRRGLPWPTDFAEILAWRRATLEEAYDNIAPARRRSRRAGAHRRDLSLARAFPDRTDARPARRDFATRPARRCATRII